MKNRRMKVTESHRNKKFRPQILLCGEWLRDAGFEYGTRIEILRQGEDILIRKV